MDAFLRWIAAAALVLGAALPARAQDEAEFYRSHPVTLVIGFSVGNAYDEAGRILARHMRDHLPGHPDILPVNMPGGGSLVSANYIYNTAPKDGTYFGLFNRSTLLDPLLGTGRGRFDPRKFGWIGSPGDEVSVCVAWHTSPVRNWNDLLTHRFVVGAGSLSADTGVFPMVLNSLFGTKMKVVTGYPGGAEINQAIESGELDGRCGWSWSAVMGEKAAWLRDKLIRVLVQIGTRKAPELPDVPLITDLATTDRQRQIMKLVVSRQRLAWPFAAPPGLPPQRLETLRAAFAATLKDPGFLADAKKLDLEVHPVSGPEAKALIEEAYAAPQPIIDDVRGIINGR